MPRDPDDDVLTDFRDDVIQPLCVEFASRIGGEEPRQFDEETRVGTTVVLPRSFRTEEGQEFTVCLESFDENTFVVKATRPDQPGRDGELRQLVLVRYDGIDESIENVRSNLDSAFEQIRQHISKERPS